MLSLTTSAGLFAQEPAPEAGPTPTSRRLRVFLDCHDCDFDYLRRQIRFVDYVRQPADAQLHVLVSAEETGAGGERFTFFFLGKGEFEGRADTLTANVAPDATDAEQRGAMTRTLELGLVGFAARTDLASGLHVVYDAGSAEAPTRSPEEDAWNLWVFRTRVGTSLEGERTEKDVSLDGSVSARRTTESLKLNFRLAGDYSRDIIKAEEEGEEDFTIVRRFSEAEGLTVWSLGDRWSLGAYAAAGSSSRRNRDLSLELAPAIEFSLFPYAESSRRQILVTYLVGPAYYDYEERTLFGKTRETLFRETLDVSAAFRQPWGQVFGSLEVSNYFSDLALHRIELFTGLEIRLFRGFSLEVDGNVARIKDQIYLPAGELTPEELLLGLRERGTDYQYELDIGFSYEFGSVFNNVVNPRMDELF